MPVRARPYRKVSCWPRSSRPEPLRGGLLGLRGEKGDADHRHAALAERAVGDGHALSAFPPPLLAAAAVLTDQIEHHVGHIAATVSPITPCLGNGPPTAA